MSALSSRVELLGAFRVLRDGQSLRVAKAGQRLLALLAICKQPIARERAAGILWSELSGERSKACLRSALWRLGVEGGPLVETREGMLALQPSVTVDLHEAESIGLGLVSGVVPPRRRDELLDMFNRELLPDWYESWLDLEREMYREIRIHALEALARVSLAEADPFLTIRAALEVIRCDPLRSTAHHLLVEAYRAEGNIGAALNHISRYRSTIRQELRVDPRTVLADLEGELVGLGVSEQTR